MGVNHVAHFLLTRELLPLIKNSSNGRIINVSSRAHIRAQPSQDDLLDFNCEKREYQNLSQYAKTKLANILFSLELQNKLKNSNVCVYSVHPGIVATDLVRDFPKSVENFLRPIINLLFKTPEQGASTQIMLASDPSLQTRCSRYWADCDIHEEAPFAKNPIFAKNLWAKTESLLQQFGF